jgi:hypothetical protein
MKGCAIAALAFAPAAMAQEAMFTQAATMPSPGTGVWRQLVHYSEYSGPHGAESQVLEVMAAVQFGLARDLSLTLEAPVVWHRMEHGDGTTDRDFGVDELNLMLKWRFYKEDTGGVDTRRAALLLGAEFPSGSGIADNSVDPYIGAVYTQVWGRHGFNQDAIFRLNTGGASEDNFGGEGSAEAIFLNTAYLYRIAPAAYTSDTKGSYYLTTELSQIYETNGDYEVRFAPGIMFEGWQWAWEAMVQLPVYEDVDKRPELDWSVGFGIRLSF